MDSQIIKKIIEAAIHAPSGDNVQPWKLEISGDWSILKIYNLPELDTSYYNYRQAAAYVAHGALIENIAIASRQNGCQLDVSLFPDSDNPDHVATINFQSSQPIFDPLYEMIFKRSTNRFPYENGSIAEEGGQRLREAVKAVEGVTGYFVEDRGVINKLAKTLMANDQLVFERSDFHGFLFNQIRWSQQQVESTRDGMPVGVLGLNALERLFFPLMRHWRIVKLANVLGLSKIIGFKCWWNVRSAALIGQIAVKKYDRPAFIQAGRALQRVWLEATRQGLAFQPIIGLPLLAYRLKENALFEFSDVHQQIVADAEKHLRAWSGIDQSDQWVVSFRIGFGKDLSSKTLRRVPEVLAEAK